LVDVPAGEEVGTGKVIDAEIVFERPVRLSSRADAPVADDGHDEEADEQISLRK
jgi:hypothetical protein